MKWNNDSNLSIVDDITFWTGADTTRYPLVDRARNANAGLDRVVSIILESDKTYKWDDANNSTQPIGTTNLVASQEDYSITTSQLTINKIRIKDQQGNWNTLEQVSRDELTDAQLTATAGDPKRYFIEGNSYYLNPKPSYSSSGGIEVYAQRGGSRFSATGDDTHEPGVAVQFHRIISLYVSEDYLAVNSMNARLAEVRNRIQITEEAMRNYYTMRNRDGNRKFKLQREDFGESELGTEGRWSGNVDGF